MRTAAYNDDVAKATTAGARMCQGTFFILIKKEFTMTKEKQEHLILQIKYAFSRINCRYMRRNCRYCIWPGAISNFCLSHRPLSPASISSTDGTSDHLVISAFQQSEPERHVTDF